MTESLNTSDKLTASLLWFVSGLVTVFMYTVVKGLPDTVLGLVTLYLAALIVAPAVSYVVLAFFGIIAWPLIDFLRLVGESLVASYGVLTKPKRSAVLTYMDWRKPEKPESHVESTTEVWPVKKRWYKTKRGQEYTSDVYKYESTKRRLNCIKVHSDNYSLEEFVSVSLNGDGEIVSAFESPDWGKPKDRIEEWDTWYSHDNRVEITCDIEYNYDAWENEWTPYVANYEIETIEENIEGGNDE